MTTYLLKSSQVLTTAFVIAVGSFGYAGAQEQPLQQVEKPLAPEHNPPGDIPDNQLFVNYSSPLGFSIKVPEGWARQDLEGGAVFSDKYGRISITEEAANAAPDAASAKKTLLPQIETTGRAVKITKVKELKLPAGRAVRISYGSNSDPNPVTNKAIRLESDRYYFWKDGKLAVLDLSAPAGADTADQWTLMVKSFRWN
jgi:hypothetical protein